MPDISTFSDIACHLGEGPCWHPGRKRAYWVDILERRLLSRAMTGTTEIVDLPFMPSLALPIDDDRLLLAGSDGLVSHGLDDGANRVVLPYWTGAETRTNDGRVHPSGALWISTMGRAAERGAGVVWWYRRGEIRRILSDLTIPNAISFTPDGGTGFYADSTARTIYRIAVDPASGLPIGEAHPFIRTEGGVPDGAVVDRDGILWNARWNAGRLDGYAVEDGRRVASLAMPAKRCTCPSFAGEGLSALVVTSAYEGYDEAARAADPEAGHTFLVSGGPVGRPEPTVLL